MTVITKNQRLGLRVTEQQKQLIEKAADLTGRTVADFAVNTLQMAAERAIRDHEAIELSARSTEALVNALLNPPKPNARLRAAAKRHREVLGDRSDIAGRSTR